MSIQQRKVLVTGVGRSGTTSIYSLLQKIFEDQFPDQTDYVYEPFLWDRKTFNNPFSELAGDFKKLVSVSIEGIYHHKNIPLFCDSAESLAPESRDWLKNLFVSDQKKHSLVKMIRGNGRIELIRQLVPDVKIIALFRNPLDVINSSINLFSFFGDQFHESDYGRFIEELKDRDTTGTDFESLTGVCREFHYWESMCNHLVHRISANPHCILPIAHEQFVSQRKLVVQQICEFTGLEFREVFVSDAEQQVGPTELGKNNLTEQGYFFLDRHLGRYCEMVAKLTSLDMSDKTNQIREKFLKTEFAKESNRITDYFHSHYLGRLLDAKDSRIRSMEFALSEKNSLIQKHDREISARNTRLLKLEEELHARTAALRINDQELTRKTSRIHELEALLAETQKELSPNVAGRES